MNSKQLKRTLFLVSSIFFFSTAMMKVQGQNLSVQFHSPGLAQNIDYYSFPSMLMLKHTVGKFTKLIKNPVLMPSSNGWDRDDVSDPFVLVTADSIYLFYDGSKEGRYRIGYGVRDPTGWFWIKRKKILNQNNGQWDSFHQVDPNILKVDGEWKLYYSGNYSDSEFGYQIGLAEKLKTGEWIYPLSKPIMELDSTGWDFAGNIYIDVLYFPEQSKYKMWYTGFQGPLSAIGLAESIDWLNWQKIGDGPVLNNFPGVISPAVIFNGEKYIMYFSQLDLSKGFGTKICRAQSGDGIHWESIEDILKPTAKWEGRRLMRPNLSFFEGRVHLYYCAQKSSKWQIGTAVADAHFAEKGVWRSRVLKEKVGSLQIKFEQPQGTSIHPFIIELKSGRRIPYSLLNQAPATAGVSSQRDSHGAKMLQIRKDVYSTILTDIDVEGEWQIELELETTVENRSPVIYEINFD